MYSESGQYESSDMCLDILGRSAATRRFLLTLQLTTSYHLSSRPISKANDSFFQQLLKYSDDIWEALHTEPWELLSQRIEEGISTIQPMSRWAESQMKQKELAWKLGVYFRRYFRELNIPWSSLPPVDQFTLDQWPKADQILLAIGPNIGIGDEMIFFRLAQRLSHRYPSARIEVSTFHPSLWDLCPGISEIKVGQLIFAPFAWAKTLLTQHPTALVIFVEFASAPIYRQLEQVRGFDRFVYLDTGARLVRMIDKKKPAIFEYISMKTSSIYDALDDLLMHIGLNDIKKEYPQKDYIKVNPPCRTIFINTFTSKDTSRLSPEWWAEIVNTTARSTALNAEIFAGINDNTRGYANTIKNLLSRDVCSSSLFGAEQTPTIGDTLRKAISCDAVLGIDTFTGHLFNIKSIPCVTVFLSSSWHAWQVPDPTILNVSIYDDPKHIGNLLSKLLIKNKNKNLVYIAHQVIQETEQIQRMLSPVNVIGLLSALRRCMDLLQCMEEIDGDLAASFPDLPPVFIDPVIQALSAMDSPTESLQRLLEDAWQQWKKCNFSRYLQFLVREGHA